MTTSPQGFSVALLASDEAVRAAASSVLVECAYKVTTAVSVEECLQLCTTQRVDIVLAESRDLTASPEKSLQLMASLQSVPLIVISNDDSPAVVFHGLKIGAVDFLKWPLDKNKVQSMWQHTLQKRMVGTPSLVEESTQAARRGPPGGGSQQDASGAGASRTRGGSVPSEGSSNQQKETIQSTLESSAVAAKQTEVPPHETAAQNFMTERSTPHTVPAPLQPSPSTNGPSAAPALFTTTQPGSEPRKRSHKATGKQSKRRIQPKLSNRDAVGAGSSSRILQQQQPSTSSDSMVMPPLLGIPPGCVPPVGSNGEAIGMPFLNQHPFVPSGPMSVGNNTFGFIPPFMYGHPGDPDMMGGTSSASFDANLFASCPFPHFHQISAPMAAPHLRPSPAVNPQTLGKEQSLHRVSSSPNAMTTAPIGPEVMTASEEVLPESPSHRALRKSPSLVNF